MGEDQFRQVEHRGRTATAIFGVVQGASPFERERITEIMVGEEIESLKEKIVEKNEEISRLNKAMKDLEDKNKKLDVALKTRIEEITKLKTRIGKLETEKKGLEDKLRNVEGKLDRVEKEVEELEKANRAHDEENVNLREHLEIMSGEMESVKKDLVQARNENQNLKREVKDLQDSHQKLMPLLLPLGVREGRQMLSAPPSVSPDQFQASLRLGELSRQLQARMYAYVLPQLFTPIGNYKVKTIRRDVEKLPKTEEEKEKARLRWDELQKKLNWNETYEEAMKQLQLNRNADAHPKITTQLLHEAVQVMDSKGNLKGWLSRDCVNVLIAMWEQLSHCN